jgi:hypothetical protein
MFYRAPKVNMVPLYLFIGFMIIQQGWLPAIIHGFLYYVWLPILMLLLGAFLGLRLFFALGRCDEEEDEDNIVEAEMAWFSDQDDQAAESLRQCSKCGTYFAGKKCKCGK